MEKPEPLTLFHIDMSGRNEECSIWLYICDAPMNAIFDRLPEDGPIKSICLREGRVAHHTFGSAYEHLPSECPKKEA